MTNEERDLITRFIQRVGGVPQASGFGGTVPATQPPAQPLPPIDRDADALIGDLFNRNPEARYRITQLAFVQEHALVEAQNVINRLQWELQQAKQAAAQQPQSSPWGAAAQPQQSSGGGIFSGLFGSGRPQQAAPPPPPPPQYAPPPPQYPPGYQPGMFGQSGTGFFGSALRTAAGVAGGVLAADAITSLFRGGAGGFGGGFGGGYPAAPMGFVPEAAPQANPWGGGGGSAPDPYDQGGAAKDSSDTGWTSTDPGSGQGGWQDTSQTDSGWQDTSQQSDSGWQDASNDDGGGWTDTSGSDPTTC